MSDLPIVAWIGNGDIEEMRKDGRVRSVRRDVYWNDDIPLVTLASAQQRIEELERALGELVALEDLRILIRMAEAHPLGTAFEDMSAEYNRRKPAVLAAARALAAREVLP